MLSTNRTSRWPAITSVLTLLALGVTPFTLAQAPSAQPTPAVPAAPMAAASQQQTPSTQPTPLGLHGAQPGTRYSPPPATPFVEPTQAPSTGDAAHQGIKMHGHWVIDVKNPDGTVVEHRDFENSLEVGGAAIFVDLLGGLAVPNDFGIYLFANASPFVTPCANTISSTTYQGCVILRNLNSSPGIYFCPSYLCSTNLTEAFNTSVTTLNSNSIVLSGSITANQAGKIDTVYTDIGICPGQITGLSGYTTTSPSACNAAAATVGPTTLSGATITSVSVVQNQIIQVTVTITFS